MLGRLVGPPDVAGRRPKPAHSPWGASAIAAVVGYKDDGTIEGMIWVQKRLRLLQDLGWNYGGSTEMHCGLDRTLKAQKCLVHVVAHVEGKDSDRGESSAFEAMLIATGFRHACQCPMRGVGETGLQVWAPGPLKTVLADPQHDLHEYARKGIAPTLTPPLAPQQPRYPPSPSLPMLALRELGRLGVARVPVERARGEPPRERLRDLRGEEAAPPAARTGGSAAHTSRVL